MIVREMVRKVKISGKKYVKAALILLVFAALILSMAGIKKKEENNLVGGPGATQFTTLGTIRKINPDAGTATVRVHGEKEDYNYEYKSVVNYLDDDLLELKFDHQEDCEELEIGEVIAFHYFQSDEEEEPLPVWSAEVLGREAPGFDPERMELVPAEGVILEISEEPGTMRVAADFGDSGEMEVVLRINYRLPKPSEYFEEGQKILFYYEPDYDQSIPRGFYIGSYEKQIKVLGE